MQNPILSFDIFITLLLENCYLFVLHYFGVKMSRTIIYFLVFLSIVMPVSVSAACKCPQKGGVKAEFDKHDVVFLGQVLNSKAAGLIRPGFTLVTFMPIKIYKGNRLLPNPEVITIFTPDTPGECGLTFSKRIDYVVFASGKPAFLRSDSCTRTDIQENSKAMLIELEKLKKEN
jgi:hypothetical protein